MSDILVGSRAVADTYFRSQSWVRSMVNRGLVNDTRPNKGKGLRMAFGLYEFYEFTALVTPVKHGSFRVKKYLEGRAEFTEALDAFMNSGGRGKWYWLLAEEGYHEGWYFPELAERAVAAFSMAVHLEKQSPTLASRHELHASL